MGDKIQVYPKIETLFKRDEKTFKVTGVIRCPEFNNIKNWLITEKIDGRNQRVIFGTKESAPEFKGRTNRADMPPFLLDRLKEIFTLENYWRVFDNPADVCLYLEAYGEHINKGGNYRKGVSFRLFDVWVNGWWLEWANIVAISKGFNIETVPIIGIMDLDKAVNLIKSGSLYSIVSEKEIDRKDFLAEGIVATAYPLMLFRNGNPLKWKLKRRDF